MAVSRGAQRLGEILVRAGLVDAMQVKSGLAHVEQWGGRLPSALSELGVADEDALAAAIAKAYDLGTVALGTAPRDAAALKLLDPAFCKKHAVFPVSLRERVLTLAVADPSDLEGLDAAKARALGRVTVAIATESSVMHAIERHYFNRTPRIVSNKARKAVTRDLPLQTDTPAGLELDTAAPPAVGGDAREPGATFDFGDAGPPPLPPEVLEKLKTVQANQEKTTLMLRAVQSLLADKGLGEKK